MDIVSQRQTHTGDLQQVPELLLPLDLHQHHRVVRVLDALQGLLDAREQVYDLLLAQQDLAVSAEGGGEGEGEQRSTI